MQQLEHIIEAWNELIKCLQNAFGFFSGSFAELADTVDEAQKAVERRDAEHKRWGHPPKRMLTHYRQPAAKVKPNARSHIKKQSDRRRA